MRKKFLKKTLTSFVLSLCVVVNVAATPMLEPSDTNIFYQIEESFNVQDQFVPPELVPTSPEVEIPEGLTPEELQEWMNDYAEHHPELFVDPIISPLVIKGSLAFAGICYMWYSTSMVMNTYSEQLEAADQWIYSQWDEISQYFQDLPAKTKATFTKMMGRYSDNEIKEAYPDITPTELSKLEVREKMTSSWLDSLVGFNDSVKAIIARSMRNKTPQGTPPRPTDTFYRILNMNHKYGTGVKIPSSVNDFFPTGQPYGISYKAQLQTYNYGWEYVDLFVYYSIPKLDNTNGDLTIRLSYISRLSPNQQYDGRLYPTIDYGKTSQAIYVTVYDDKTTFISNKLYGKNDSGSLINGSMPKDVRTIVQEQCGFSPNVDDTLWHSWIDFCPLPNDIVISSGMAPIRNVYQKNGYEFPIQIVPPKEIPLTDISRSDIPNGILNTPLDRPELVFDNGLKYPIKIPSDEVIKPIPPVEPLPNPIDTPLPPDPPIDPNPEIPNGFFDFIMSWMNKVWGWLTSFFTNLWDGFMQVMKDLLIPDDDFFTGSFNKFKDEIGAAFGYLNWDQFTELSNIGAVKPDFSVRVYGKTVQLIDLGFWEKYKKVIQGFIIGVVGILLFLYNIRMVQWLIRASDSQHQSHNVNQSSDRTTKGGRFL